MVDMESDTHEGCLTVWQLCHTDDVAAVDINTDKQQVSCLSGLRTADPSVPSVTSVHSASHSTLLVTATLAAQAHQDTFSLDMAQHCKGISMLSSAISGKTAAWC